MNPTATRTASPEPYFSCIVATLSLVGWYLNYNTVTDNANQTNTRDCSLDASIIWQHIVIKLSVHSVANSMTATSMDHCDLSP